MVSNAGNRLRLRCCIYGVLVRILSLSLIFSGGRWAGHRGELPRPLPHPSARANNARTGFNGCLFQLSPLGLSNLATF